MMRLLLVFSIHRHPSSILRRARLPNKTAFARHGSRALWGNPGKLRRPRFTKCLPFLRLTGASVHDSTVSGPQAHRSPELNSSPCPHTPRTALAPGTSGGSGQSPATKSHQMLSVAATYRTHPSMMQLLLALRLSGPRVQFFAAPACPPGTAFARHWRRGGRGDLGNLRRPSFTKWRPLPRQFGRINL